MYVHGKRDRRRGAISTIVRSMHTHHLLLLLLLLPPHTPRGPPTRGHSFTRSFSRRPPPLARSTRTEGRTGRDCCAMSTISLDDTDIPSLKSLSHVQTCLFTGEFNENDLLKAAKTDRKNAAVLVRLTQCAESFRTFHVARLHGQKDLAMKSYVENIFCAAYAVCPKEAERVILNLSKNTGGGGDDEEGGTKTSCSKRKQERDKLILERCSRRAVKRLLKGMNPTTPLPSCFDS